MSAPPVIEQWQAVPGFEGRYEVSSSGHVASLVTGERRLLALVPSTGRYLRVTLTEAIRPKRQQQFAVHRLIALAFHGECPPGYEVRHLDGDRQNNVATNLAYGTRSENRLDSVEHGTHRNTARTHCPQGHAYTPDNCRARKAGGRDCLICHRDRERSRATAHREKASA